MKEPIQTQTKKKIPEKIKTIGGYVIIALIPVVFFLFFGIAHVNGESMSPKYHNGNLLLTGKFIRAGRGDIVAVRAKVDGEDTNLIKRVIAMGGDVVDIRQNKVYVNGEEIDEPYIKEEMQEYKDSIEFPYTVPQGELFVMGDNRNNSLDSRYKNTSPIKESDVIGVVLFKL